MSQTPGNDNRPVAGPENPPPLRKPTKQDFEEANAGITDDLMGIAEKLRAAGYTDEQIQERVTMVLMSAVLSTFNGKK